MKPNPPNVRIETVTLAMAVEWLALIGVQRQQRPRYIEELAMAMLRGEWRWSNDVVTFVGKLGSRGCRLTNGQHRLAAIVRANELSAEGGGTEIVIPLIVGDGYTEDAALTFDVGRKRSLADALDFFHGGLGHRDASELTKLAWHVEQGTWANRTPTPTIIQQIEFEKQNPDLNDVIDDARRLRKGIGHGGIAGYGVALWQISRGGGHLDRLASFVDGAATGLNLSSKNDPRYLLRAMIQRRQGNDTRRPWWIAGTTVLAWNAYASGVEPKQLRNLERTDMFPDPTPVGFRVLSRVRRGKGWSAWAQVFHSLDAHTADTFMADTRERWDRDGVEGEIKREGTGPE